MQQLLQKSISAVQIYLLNNIPGIGVTRKFIFASPVLPPCCKGQQLHARKKVVKQLDKEMKEFSYMTLKLSKLYSYLAHFIFQPRNIHSVLLNSLSHFLYLIHWKLKNLHDIFE